MRVGRFVAVSLALAFRAISLLIGLAMIAGLCVAIYATALEIHLSDVLIFVGFIVSIFALVAAILAAWLYPIRPTQPNRRT